MTGAPAKDHEHLARQARVREYLVKGYSKESIAKILGISVRTAARDSAKVWLDVRRELIGRPMDQAVDEFEVSIKQQIDDARAQHDIALGRGDTSTAIRYARLLKDLNESLINLRQKAGRATIVATKVDVVQHVDNPLENLTWDNDTKRLVEKRSTTQS